VNWRQWVVAPQQAAVVFAFGPMLTLLQQRWAVASKQQYRFRLAFVPARVQRRLMFCAPQLA